MLAPLVAHVESYLKKVGKEISGAVSAEGGSHGLGEVGSSSRHDEGRQITIVKLMMNF